MFDTMLAFINSILADINGIAMGVTGWVNTVAHGQDFLAGMIFTALATGATYGTYFFTRTIPGAIKRRIIVRFTIDRDQNIYKYEAFIEKLEQFSTALGSRSFVAEPHSTVEGNKMFHGYRLIPGLGFHWFIFNKRLYWYNIFDLPSDGSEKQKKRLSVMTYGYGPKPLETLLEYLRDEIDRKWNFIYNHDTKGQVGGSSRAVFPHIDDLCLNPEVKAYFNRLCETFPKRVAHAEEHDMTYKYVGCLYGEPGSGKTSLLCSVAKAMGITNVITVDLGELESNASLRTLFNMDVRSRNQPNFIIIEDMHGIDALLKEEYKDKKLKFDGGITLDGLLNAMNGVIPLHNTIVFFTTNYIERLDSAITRPGRTTHVMELPRIEPDVVNEYMADRIEGWENIVDVPLRGCDLGQLIEGADFDKEAAHRIYDDIKPKLPEKETYVYQESNKITF